MNEQPRSEEGTGARAMSETPVSPSGETRRLDHCFREDNCATHSDHQGDECCCCGLPANVHEGCDCE